MKNFLNKITEILSRIFWLVVLFIFVINMAIIFLVYLIVYGSKSAFKMIELFEKIKDEIVDFKLCNNTKHEDNLYVNIKLNTNEIRDELRKAGAEFIKELKNSSQESIETLESNLNKGLSEEKKDAPDSEVVQAKDIPEWLDEKELKTAIMYYAEGKKITAIKHLQSIAKDKSNIENTLKWSKDYLENIFNK